jgi:beta propeller repeat protein
MDQAPPRESLASKIIFIAVLAVLVIIMIACALFIFSYFSPGSVSMTTTPTPAPTPLPTITATPTPLPTPEATIEPVPQYQNDIRITKGTSTYKNPGMWDNYVVYEDVKEGVNKVYLYEIKTGTERILSEGAYRAYGAIDSGKVSLIDVKNSDVYIMDISSGGKTKLTLQENKPRICPAIFGNRLVYCQDDGAYSDYYQKWQSKFSIYMCDIPTMLTSCVGPDISEPADIRVYENKVIWVSKVDGKSSIYLFDIPSGTTKKITGDNALNDHPRIYGNTIVYHSDQDEGHHIYAYNIENGQTSKISFAGKQYNVDIYGNKVVYDDMRAGNWNIYMYDLTTRQEKCLTTEPHDQLNPQIFGNNIVYMDNRNGGWDVYLLSIE